MQSPMRVVIRAVTDNLVSSTFFALKLEKQIDQIQVEYLYNEVCLLTVLMKIKIAADKLYTEISSRKDRMFVTVEICM